MSASDVAAVSGLTAGPGVTSAQRPARSWLRLLRSELRLVFRRPRNIALLGALACAPLVLGFAVWLSSPSANSGGPGFLNQVSHNGVFLALFALFMTLPLFLPLAVAVVAGESVAGETGSGTLRVLLAIPAGRTRLLAVKFTAVTAFAFSICAVVALVGVLAGAVFFGIGPVTLLSGNAVSLAAGLWRVVLVVAYLTAALTSLGAIGIAISTWTQHAVAVMASVLAVAVASEIANAVPQFSAIQPVLPTHWWESFDALLRMPIGWGDIGAGLLSFGCYFVIAAAVAWARFTTRDVSC